MQTDQEFSSIVNLPQFPGPSVVSRSNAPEDPHQATAITIERMKQWAAHDASSPQVMRATSHALMLAGPDQEQRSVAIHHWISNHCRFREDDPVLRIVLGLEDELEMLITPARLLTMQCPAGDCDCLTTLCMSMHLCAGIPVEPITIKADPEEPERDSHVYCQAVLENGNLILDPAMGCKHHWPAGAEAPDYFDKQTWGILQPERPQRGLQGLGDPTDGSLYAQLIGQGVDPVDAAAYLNPGELPGGATGPINPSTATAPSASIDFNKLLQQLTAGGLKIATMQATPVGYIQTPQGLVANVGPGGQLPLNLGIGAGLSSISPLLLLGGGALLLFALLGRK